MYDWLERLWRRLALKDCLPIRDVSDGRYLITMAILTNQSPALHKKGASVLAGHDARITSLMAPRDSFGLVVLGSSTATWNVTACAAHQRTASISL